MSIIKKFSWNIINKVNYVYNLKRIKCKRSYFIIFTCNAIRSNSLLNRDTKEFLNYTDIIMNNSNKNISTTASESPGVIYWSADGGNSSGISHPNQQCHRRSKSGFRNSGIYEESNSKKKRGKSLDSKIQSSETNGQLNIVEKSFVNTSVSFTQLNLPLFHNVGLQTFEQRNYTTLLTGQLLRDVYLFNRNEPENEEANLAETSCSEQSSSTDQCISNITKKEREDYKTINAIRSWMPVNTLVNSSSADNSIQPGLEFTLMSYNVLAQDLLTEHPYLYRNHSARALLWEYRWKNLYREIKTHNSDIICLQEVQESHWHNYFAQFKNLGYASIYKKRTGIRTDGCAIFYRKSVLKLIENTTIEYNQDNPVLNRDNIAIVAKFAPIKKPDVEFVVATTHLLYNPKRQDVRLAQTQVLLTEVDRLAYRGGFENKYTPIIITGDFNSEPDSAVYALIVNGSLRYDNLANRTLLPNSSKYGLAGKLLIPPSLRITDNCQHLDLLEHRAVNAQLSRSDELKLVHLKHSKRPTVNPIKVEGNDTLFSTGVLTHELNLKSAFLHGDSDDTEGTTYQDKWITVDYIFYSGAYNKSKSRIVDNKLELISRYSIPTISDFKRIRNIPNFALGSDHLALLTKFKLLY